MSETSITFGSSCFIHSECGSSPVKMYMQTGEDCWKKNNGAQWARTSNLWISSLTHSLLSYVGRYVEWDLNFYCTLLYIATMLHLTAKPRGRPVASSMYHIIFITTENIAVDEIGRTICSHLLARAQLYFYIELLCMYDAITCNIVALL